MKTQAQIAADKRTKALTLDSAKPKKQKKVVQIVIEPRRFVKYPDWKR
jgi:hypothetical protein